MFMRLRVVSVVDMRRWQLLACYVFVAFSRLDASRCNELQCCLCTPGVYVTMHVCVATIDDTQ